MCLMVSVLSMLKGFMGDVHNEINDMTALQCVLLCVAGDADECNKQGVGSTTAATTATSAPTTAPTTATTATPDSSNFLLG